MGVLTVASEAVAAFDGPGAKYVSFFFTKCFRKDRTYVINDAATAWKKNAIAVVSEDR